MCCQLKNSGFSRRKSPLATENKSDTRNVQSKALEWGSGIFPRVSSHLFLSKFLFLNLNITFFMNPKLAYLRLWILQIFFLRWEDVFYNSKHAVLQLTPGYFPHSLFLSQVVLPLSSVHKVLLEKFRGSHYFLASREQRMISRKKYC